MAQSKARKSMAVRALAAAALVVATMTAGSTLVTTAEANSCQQSCRASWNQCRIATKGSSSCDAQLQSCMSACIPKR